MRPERPVHGCPAASLQLEDDRNRDLRVDRLAVAHHLHPVREALAPEGVQGVIIYMTIYLAMTPDA